MGKQQNNNVPVGLTAAHMLLEIAFHIPFLADEKPIGIMMIAQPGMGKSMLLTRFESEKIMRFNDLTGWGLEQVLISCRKLDGGFVVIPDLLRLLARKNGFEAFLTMGNILLEEGYESVVRWDINVKLKRPVNAGIITALTHSCYQRYFKHFEKTGFLSRFGVFGFSYADSDRRRIANMVSQNSDTVNSKILIQPSKGEKKKIQVPRTAAKAIKRLGTMLSNGDPAPFRSIVFIRRLCKACALMHGRRSVAIQDIRVVFALLPFLLPPHQTTTDLDYHLLRGASVNNLSKKYSMQEINDAQQRLISRHLDWELFSKK